MSSFMYNGGKAALLKGDADLVNDSIKVALVTSSYAPDKDTDIHFQDISNEVTGSGYTAGGKALANGAVTQDDANDRAVFNADDLSWPAATFTTRAGVIYKDSGNPATSPLIAYADFGDDFSLSGEDFTIEWHQDGILYLGD